MDYISIQKGYFTDGNNYELANTLQNRLFRKHDRMAVRPERDHLRRSAHIQ